MYRDDPPGQSVLKVVKELYDYTVGLINHTNIPYTFNVHCEITFQDPLLMDKFLELQRREYECTRNLTSTNPNFLSEVNKKKQSVFHSFKYERL